MARSLDLRVGREQAGLRLDQFIARAGGISRGEARRALHVGGVFLDRARVKIASRPVREGQRVEVYLEEGGRAPPAADEPFDPARLLFQAEDVLVVNKPAGVPTQATRAGDRGTLSGRVAALLALRNRRERAPGPLGGGPFVGPGHRLDRGTSGVCALGLTPAAQRALMRAFREGKVEKEYLALCAGLVPERARVDGPLGPDPSRPGRVQVRAGGEPAITRVERRAALHGASLVACFPETGRTHQIRAHLSSLGHPLLGDPLYGGPSSVTLAGGARARVARPMLHAARLAFPLPSGRRVEVRAEPPEDFSRLQAELATVGAGR